MSRVFTAPLDAISVTTDADQDIIEMVGASGYPFALLAIELYSSLTTDERVRLRMVRRSTTGSGGSALTEIKNDAGSAANQTAVSTLVTTPGTIGDIGPCFYWSQLGPFIYRPTPKEIMEIASGGRLALNLQSAVASTRTWSGYLVFEEFG
jgi:hypothetical protein